MAVELEGLSYEIEAQVGDSAKQLDTLASSLEKLKSASGGLKLGNISNQLKRLSEALSGIETKNVLKLRQMSKALGELASAGDIRISKSIGTGIASIGKGMDSITDEKIDRISRLAEALKKLGEAGPVKMPSLKNLDRVADTATSSVKYAPSTDVKPVADDIGQPQAYTVDMDTAFRQWQDATHELTTAGRVAVGVYNGVNNAIISAGNALRSLGAMAVKVLPQTAEFGKNLAIGFAKLPLVMGGKLLGNMKGIVSSLGGIFSGLMRIAKFRLYRTIIKLFTEGLKEGLDNLYYYSQMAGTNFASALDSIATSANYVKNSLGAMASPLIEALAPAIDFIADKVVALFNLINQLFARLTGRSTYTAAKKISATYKDATDSAGKGASGAAKKASDELKKTILAFDEINKLNDPNKSSGSGGGGGAGGSGGGSNYGDMFEELPIEDNIANFADRIKALINAGDWEGLGRLFGDKLNQIFDLGGGAEAEKKWTGWGHKVAGYVNRAIDIAYGFLDETKFRNIGNRIAQFMNGLFDDDQGINFSKLGKTLSLAFTDAIDFAIGFVEDFDTEDFGKSINKFMTGFFDKFTEWVNDSDKDWEGLGATLEEKVSKFVFGLDSQKIADSFGRAVKGAINAVVKMAKGYVGTEFEKFKAWVDKKWDEVGLTGVLGILLQKMGDGAFNLSNPLPKIWEYFIDPVIGALIGEDTWEDVKQAGQTIVDKMVEGFRTAFDPVGWVKKNIINPIVQALQDKLNWKFDMPDIFGGLFGGGGEKKPIQVPLSPKVQNNSGSWLSDIQKWWGNLFGGNKNKQEFSSQPDKSDSKKWPGYIGDWWGGQFSGNKNVQQFQSEPNKNSSRSWLGSIQNWWNGLFGGKKNTQMFNAEGNATQLHDKIPRAQKSFDSTALFKEGTDKLTAEKKTFNTTANFNKRNNLSEELRTFWSIANFGERTGVTKDFCTFYSYANFGKREGVTKDFCTFYSYANFKERMALTKALCTFYSYADFQERQNNLTSDERTFDSKAWFIDADQKKTFTVRATAEIRDAILNSNGSRFVLAEGGVFTGKGKVPIQRYASGGLPSGSQLFWAREAGPELVGTLGSHTAVMNNNQIVASVSAGVARAIAGIHFRLDGMPKATPIDQYVSPPEPSHADGNAEMISEARQQNALLRRQNDLLQRLLEKDTKVEVTTKQFASAANRQNRREGRTTIAVSAT